MYPKSCTLCYLLTAYTIANHRPTVVFIRTLLFLSLKFSFSSRIVNIWNSLPDTVVDAETIDTFKRRLDKHWLNQDVVYDFYAELLTGTGGALN